MKSPYGFFLILARRRLPFEMKEADASGLEPAPAMFYLWYADKVDNTLSGHQKEKVFCQLRTRTVCQKTEALSVIASLLSQILKSCQGGPLTMEFHSTVLPRSGRRPEGSATGSTIYQTWRAPATAQFRQPRHLA